MSIFNNHLDLETCKKLKVAGFPQDTDFHFGGYTPWPAFKRKNHSEGRKSGSVACPTADELLEALPKEFATERDNGRKTDHYALHIDWNGGSWSAAYSWYDDSKYLEVGCTPAQALANLWLELNKPNARP